ncbi:MAG: hypothetical protein ACLVL2_12950 [Bacteroides cellulosilyticus]
MKSNLIMLCLLGLSSTLNAQDPRERHYYYEILDPRHEPKPLVEGFARERVTENLNRGLTVTPARDGKGIYLSWRLIGIGCSSVLHFMSIGRLTVKRVA